MTNVLNNLENIIDDSEEKRFKIENTKVETILLYYKIKKIIKSNYAQSLIKKYITTDKDIKSGSYIIKGTRLTPEDIGRILYMKKDLNVEDILSEYPSLENEGQVTAALLVYVQNNISLFKILITK